MIQMQTRQSEANFITGLRGDRSRARLLLIASEDSFKNQFVYGPLAESHVLDTRRADNLADGLSQLDSEAIDLVLVSLEFGPTGLSGFVSDARRLGFAGPILHVASSSAEAEPLLAAKDFAAGPSTPTQRERAQAGGAKEEGEASSEVRKTDNDSNHPIDVRLTIKERAVLVSVSEGLSNQQIARRLSCSEGSVKAIIQQLFDKMGVRKRAQLVRIALDRTLLATGTNYTYEAGAAACNKLGAAVVIQKAGDIREQEPRLNRTDPIRVGDFIVDVSEHRTWIRGEEARLTPLEFRLLVLLSKHPMRLIHHNDLTEALWSGRPTSRDSLRYLIQAVREKIETSKQPRYIVTQFGCGYRFIPSP